MISRKERRDHKGFSNVASVIVLPLPMLPVSNWELELVTGNILTLATFLTLRSLRCKITISDRKPRSFHSPVKLTLSQEAPADRQSKLIEIVLRF
jgi:hypothetical protein